jgi:TetR/AcrR family transcriptional regulator, ethionamide resistance regulator
MPDDAMMSRRARRAQAKPRRGDDRERTLLATAERMLAGGEFADASVGQIAAAAGLSRPTFYFYFDSKEALLAQLVDRTVRDLVGRVTRTLAEGELAQQIPPALAATASIWRTHTEVMFAAVELAATVPEIGRLWSETIHETADLAAKTLRRDSPDPPPYDDETLRRIVRALTWAVERNFYILMRNNPTEHEIAQLEDDLGTIWQRTLGLTSAKGRPASPKRGRTRR